MTLHKSVLDIYMIECIREANYFFHHAPFLKDSLTLNAHFMELSGTKKVDL